MITGPKDKWSRSSRVKIALTPVEPNPASFSPFFYFLFIYFLLLHCTELFIFFYIECNHNQLYAMDIKKNKKLQGWTRGHNCGLIYKKYYSLSLIWVEVFVSVIYFFWQKNICGTKLRNRLKNYKSIDMCYLIKSSS